jgi:hypothetical protein
MIKPIPVGQTKEYILKADKENPTIWIIGSIDSKTAGIIANGVGSIEMEDGKPKFVPGERDILENDFLIVKYGLKGWKNFILDGKEVEFKTEKHKIFNNEIDVVLDSLLTMIPLFAIHELAMAIWGGNAVSEELKKA